MIVFLVVLAIVLFLTVVSLLKRNYGWVVGLVLIALIWSGLFFYSLGMNYADGDRLRITNAINYEGAGHIHGFSNGPVYDIYQNDTFLDLRNNFTYYVTLSCNAYHVNDTLIANLSWYQNTENNPTITFQNLATGCSAE